MLRAAVVSAAIDVTYGYPGGNDSLQSGGQSRARVTMYHRTKLLMMIRGVNLLTHAAKLSSSNGRLRGRKALD
jgi:hypothetical protein